jgi:hypothetical protein
MPFHPHNIETNFHGTNTELSAGDPGTMNELFHIVYADPFITPDKSENQKRVN